MESKMNILDDLFTSASRYSRASLELAKLKALDKTADIASSLGSRSLFVLAFSFCMLILTFALAFWLGDLLGKAYWGFLVVAGFYALVSGVLLLIHPAVKKRMNNALIRKMFN